MPSWQSLTEPISSPEPSGLLPEDMRGKWSPYVALKARPFKSASILPLRHVHCHGCNSLSAVPAAALSALCSQCHTHLQMGDYILRSGSRRNKIRTQGNITIAEGAYFSRLDLICNNLIMRGDGDGSISCRGSLIIYSSPSISQPLTVSKLDLRRGSSLSLSSGAHVEEAEIHGILRGFISATGRIVVKRGGSLHGDCRAKDLILEPGAQHIGRFDRI